MSNTIKLDLALQLASVYCSLPAYQAASSVALSPKTPTSVAHNLCLAWMADSVCLIHGSLSTNTSQMYVMQGMQNPTPVRADHSEQQDQQHSGPVCPSLSTALHPTWIPWLVFSAILPSPSRARRSTTHSHNYILHKTNTKCGIKS